MAERKKADDLKRKQELEQAKVLLFLLGLICFFLLKINKQKSSPVERKRGKKAIKPSEMFLKETDKYSKFDEKVKIFKLFD